MVLGQGSYERWSRPAAGMQLNLGPLDVMAIFHDFTSLDLQQSILPPKKIEITRMDLVLANGHINSIENDLEYRCIDQQNK
jgi:hypothetical protein